MSYLVAVIMKQMSYVAWSYAAFNKNIAKISSLTLNLSEQSLVTGEFLP